MTEQLRGRDVGGKARSSQADNVGGMTPILQVNNLVKIYEEKLTGLPIRALDEVSFEAYDNEVLGIIGESGSGKTTLLRLLVALEAPDEGEIYILGRKLSEWLKKDRKGYRSQVQLVFQNPYEVFDRRQRIDEILHQPLKIHHREMTVRQRQDLIKDAMIEAGLSPVETYLERFPHELSGGQLQRIAILRSMLLRPKILIADEPVSMLDVSIRADILEMLREGHERDRNTMIVVSHDILTLQNISDRIIVMLDGQIVEIIDADLIFNGAQHPYTKVLISNSLGREVMPAEIERYKQEYQRQYGYLDQDKMLEVNTGHYVNTQKIY